MGGRSESRKLSSLATSSHINTSASNDALIAEVDVVVLAVKPQAISSVIKGSQSAFAQKMCWLFRLPQVLIKLV